jgi:microcystin-dependent protein
MTDNIEVSQWETGIYQIEITDPVMGGLDGVDNRPSLELANRTARIKTVLDASGIYVVGAEHQFAGQNNDVTANFGTAANGDAVYYVNGTGLYEKLSAYIGDPLYPAVGIADVTNGRVISGGLIHHQNIPASLDGDIVYASTISGELTVTPNGSPVGRLLWKTGGSAGVVSILVGGNLMANILHSEINNDEPSIHTGLGDLIGHIGLYVAGSTPPANYLECNGASINKTTYAALYSGNPFSIGTRFGDNGGDFYLPDFRGRVARGFSNGNSRDPDRGSRYADNGGITGDAPGSMQSDEYDSHAHGNEDGSDAFMVLKSNFLSRGEVKDGWSSGGKSYTTAPSGGSETRMHNFSAMYIIRYQ